MTQLIAPTQQAAKDATVTVATAPQPAVPFFRREVVRFVCVLVQFGLLVVLIRRFDLERGPLGDVMLLAWFGFAVHHFLPIRFRLPFFAILSLVSVPTAIDLKLGAPVLLVGLVLIWICHWRLPLWQRVTLLALILAGLLKLRLTPYSPPVVVLASMFMFRLIVYLHDMKNRTAPFSPGRAVAYFFMLPNVCFPLFPVVDYKTFCSTHYNDEAARIYQTGVRWMFRGVVHLLLYRVIYQFVQEDPLRVEDLAGVARFMLATFLLYLRVSGQFHLIVGVLHLFGFNLPETHHLYLLASSFTDFWRRINIYWRDFILKTVYYPVSFRLKRWGPLRAMAAATVAAFCATWLLHIYQALWLRGTLSFTWQDAVFWWVLAALVLVNSLYEAKRGRPRSLRPAGRPVRKQLRHALRVIGTFVTICVLWTVWSCESGDELLRLAAKARNVTLPAVAGIAAFLIGIGIAGILFGRTTAERTEAARETELGPRRFAFGRSAAIVTAGTIALLLFSESYRLPAAHDTAYAEVVQSLRSDRLNDMEFSNRTRGYYEELDVTRQDPVVREGLNSVSWWPATKLLRRSPDYMLYRPIPDVSVPTHGIRISLNHRGMRGPFYKMRKPPGVFRIALIGTSTEVGRGVGDHDTFAHLLEERLNREDTEGNIRRFELWNFSVESYGAIQKLMLVEENVFDSDPDLIIWATYAPEAQRLCNQIAQALQAGYEAPAPFESMIQDACFEVHVETSMPSSRIERLLRPYAPEIMDAVFERFAQLCRSRGVRGCFMYRPQVNEFCHIPSADRQEVLGLAKKTGLPILDLAGCFGSVADKESLMVTPQSKYHWKSLKREAPDDHPNALGHELLADRLYELLHTPEGRLLLKTREINAR